MVEKEYIDRDHMEDHSVFYSRSLEKYPNFCDRVHFFRDCDSAEITTHLERLTETVAHGREAFHGACREFSKKHYLGFMVLKPLHGCPVGRTVLRTFDEVDAESGERREFRGSRPYHVHLLGATLTVSGLAFQQQDEGVSACATTAIWTSLQKLRDVEELGATTPAQITTLASRFALPFGRSMPSEGLDLDQMCQSIHALGISPDLRRTEKFAVARALIYSAVLSESAPILIIENPELGCHAVTVVGVKRRPEHEIEPRGAFLDDRSGDLTALYLHDDRIGPCIKALLTPASGSYAKLPPSESVSARAF